MKFLKSKNLEALIYSPKRKTFACFLLLLLKYFFLDYWQLTG